MRRAFLALGVLLVTSPLWAQVSRTAIWTNPTAYEDGLPLDPSLIQETRISFAPAPGGSPTIIEIAEGSVTSHVTLPVFTTGTWYARAQTVAGGVASDYSDEVSFTVGRCESNPASCRPRAPTGLTFQ